MLLTLDSSGAITLHNPARDSAASSVIVQAFDVAAQTITLANTGSEKADLSGMILFSARSDATLRFPAGTALDEGASLVIGVGEDISFTGEDKPLSKKKDNTVLLFDRSG